MTGILLAAHQLLADNTGNPELALSPNEAKSLTDATANVLRHYDVKVTQKALDHAALLMCAGGIYGIRFTAIGLRKRKEALDRTQAGQQRPQPFIVPNAVPSS